MIKENINIGIIGNGNVGYHLKKALESAFPSGTVGILSSRRPDNVCCADFDLLLISVPDGAVKEVAERLSLTDTIVAHTSGSLGMDTLERFPNRGVFYPLQTFTKEVELDYSQIPFFVEGSSGDIAGFLKSVAGRISGKVYLAGSEERKKLHLASVFACNFVFHLYSRAWHILEDTGLPWESMIPLIIETASKLKRTDPDSGQTGPASRGDMDIINCHINMPDLSPDMREEYILLTRNILNRVGKSNSISEMEICPERSNKFV